MTAGRFFWHGQVVDLASDAYFKANDAYDITTEDLPQPPCLCWDEVEDWDERMPPRPVLGRAAAANYECPDNIPWNWWITPGDPDDNAR